MNMKKITILSFLIMAFAMVSFSACSDEDTIGGGEGLSKDFVVSRSDMAFTKNGGEKLTMAKAMIRNDKIVIFFIFIEYQNNTYDYLLGVKT
jgi:hypothetical protein